MIKKIMTILTALSIGMALCAFRVTAESKASFFSDAVVDGHTYLLMNAYSCAYLEITDAASPSKLHQTTFPPRQNRDFLLKAAEKDEGYFYIIPAANQNVRLDVDNAFNKNGTVVKTFKENPAFSHAQKFKFIDNGDNTYRIQPKLSDSCVLEVAGPSISMDAQIQLWEYVGGKNQKWILIDKDKSGEPAFEIACEPNTYSAGTSNITVRLKNNSGQEIGYSQNDYKLEKWNGTAWEKFNLKRLSLDETAMIFSSNLEFCGTVTLYEDYLNKTPLPAGRYRLSYNFYGNASDKLPCYAEFTIQ